MKKGIVIVFVLVVLIGGYSFLKGNSTASNTANTAASTTASTNDGQGTPNSVVIKNYLFSPANLTIKAGTKVTWTNQDLARHTITADQPSSSAPASSLFGQNETFSFTFTTQGTYSYHCEPHPYMKGTITVTQ